jgi:hypothetical protein
VRKRKQDISPWKWGFPYRVLDTNLRPAISLFRYGGYWFQALYGWRMRALSKRKFLSARNFVHDYDLLAHLQLLFKLGKIKGIKIIGLPDNLPIPELVT